MYIYIYIYVKDPSIYTGVPQCVESTPDPIILDPGCPNILPLGASDSPSGAEAAALALALAFRFGAEAFTLGAAATAFAFPLGWPSGESLRGEDGRAINSLISALLGSMGKKQILGRLAASRAAMNQSFEQTNPCCKIPLLQVGQRGLLQHGRLKGIVSLPLDS